MNVIMLREQGNDLSETAFYMDPFTFDTSVVGSDDENYLQTLDKNFAKCLTKRGILFSTTGLRNLQYSASSLNHFATLFSNDINRQECDDLESESYQVELVPLASEMHHPCPLKVCVQRRADKTQFVYVGVFYSWRETGIRPCREYLNMSYIFVTGSQKIRILMNDLYQKYFGCKITPMVFTQCEIKWLLAIMTQCVDDSFPNDILFTYQMNFDSSKLEFNYPFTNLKEIWNDIHDKNENVIKYEEVVRLYAAIDEHILESSALDLSHYLLKRFSLPQLITLDTNGKINSLKLGAFDLICRFIKEIRSY